jgi:hypothetical protein
MSDASATPARVAPRSAAVLVVWLLVFASVVSWRKGVLYSGGSDPVVVAKAVVAVCGALAAIVLWRTAPSRRALSPFPVLLVVAIVGVSLIGSIQAGAFAANVVLAVRIAILAFTIVLVLAATPTREAIACMLGAMAAIGLVAAGSGALQILLKVGASRGRLGGGIPPLEPNELATLVLPAAIGLMYLVLRNGLKPAPVAGLLLLSGIIAATGSRVALAMLLVGAIVIVLRERRLSFGVLVVVLIGLVGAYAVVMFSSTVTDITLRGQGVDRLLTLNSRTISWSAVLDTPSDEWPWWIGNGLSMKSVPVLGQAWATQVFDSSWISSIAQDGAIGTVLLVGYALGTLIAVARRRSLGSLGLAIVGTILIRSFFENGLIESSTTFAVFFALALASWPGTQETARRVDRVTATRRQPLTRVVQVPVWDRTS